MTIFSFHRLASHPAVLPAIALAACAGLVACSPPEEGSESSADDHASPSPAATENKETEVEPSKPETKAKPSKPETAGTPALAESTTPAVFDLVRKGDVLVLTGTLRSSYQAEDIAIALRSLSELTLDNQLVIDPNAEGVDWGNRISGLLPDLAMSVTDLHFHIEEGVVTVRGKVATAAEVNRLQRSVAYTIESPKIKELKNELEAEAPGKGKGTRGAKDGAKEAKPGDEATPPPSAGNSPQPKP